VYLGAQEFRRSIFSGGRMSAYSIGSIELSLATFDIRRAVLKNFYSSLETHLAAAHADGIDLAVSEFDWADQKCTAEIRRYRDGDTLPGGRRWTIYRSSQRLPTT
jgi:hypothetical protein